ncbi:HU family DNA-binding protein [Fictibacillus sp. WQ 8-8]|uniref:HU family DNA-binding protein n=1 Tax=Fictibacillus marinisediminis TaxID=2878389 RepID=A0A9X2BEE0_9BACL|nr:MULTISPECIES: HU family DNA-binding protein [Fictibacillus]SFF18168.1 DNA-binding protein HU-beta [Bacillus sp. OV194]MCK6256002.1 HU family DNA-binding protein [Fictibacillus marinisediminis]MCQ6266907.1 HU family DNA-binding protein [Fictibacillus sp. WQ 8-8]MED2973940.1 HU family DNA-binding protein [Fictibacillus sp. B-59209]UZJ78069.1 HU family DNA-binding protein [Fictibacillus sp. KU28468]
MRKQDLVDAVKSATNMNKKESTLAVEAVLESITNALRQGESVQLIGFGTFETRNRNARKGRNPLTGEEIMIAASSVPAFKPGKSLKEAVKAV